MRIAALLLLSFAAGEEILPLKVGSTWTYQTAQEVDQVTEVTGKEKVGDVECFIVERKSFGRMLRREWLAVTDEGVKVHKVQSGKTEMTVEKPFFRIKHVLKKDDEWTGYAHASVNPARYFFRVEGQEEVTVPAGSWKAWKIHTKVERGENNIFEGSEWFVPDVGVVKSDIDVRTSTQAVNVTMELKEYKKGG